MSQHRATVEWNRQGSEFTYETYSRAHSLRFQGIEVQGNAAPGNIPATVKPRAGLDPEQAFVASLSSEEHRALHHKAHEKCFIANSVKTEVVVEPC